MARGAGSPVVCLALPASERSTSWKASLPAFFWASRFGGLRDDCSSRRLIGKALRPCHEPTADVAATRNRGQIIEFAEHGRRRFRFLFFALEAEPRHALQSAEAEAGAADASAGEAECGGLHRVQELEQLGVGFLATLFVGVAVHHLALAVHGLAFDQKPVGLGGLRELIA